MFFLKICLCDTERERAWVHLQAEKGAEEEGERNTCRLHAKSRAEPWARPQEPEIRPESKPSAGCPSNCTTQAVFVLFLLIKGYELVVDH